MFEKGPRGRYAKVPEKTSCVEDYLPDSAQANSGPGVSQSAFRGAFVAFPEDPLMIYGGCREGSLQDRGRVRPVFQNGKKREIRRRGTGIGRPVANVEGYGNFQGPNGLHGNGARDGECQKNESNEETKEHTKT